MSLTIDSLIDARTSVGVHVIVPPIQCTLGPSWPFGKARPKPMAAHTRIITVASRRLRLSDPLTAANGSEEGLCREGAFDSKAPTREEELEPIELGLDLLSPDTFTGCARLLFVSEGRP